MVAASRLDQHHGAGVAGEGIFQRREILPLAIAAGDQHDLAAQAFEGGHGGADVGAFGIVVVDDAVGPLGHRFNPVRQTAKSLEGDEQRRAGQASGFAQGQRGQGVGHVVAAGE